MSYLKMAFLKRGGALLVVTILVIAIVGTYYGAQLLHRPTSENEIRIGTVLSLTGVFAAIGQDEKVALDFMMQRVNSEGGLWVENHSRRLPVRIIIYDDQSDFATSVSLVEKLITQDRIQALLGGSTAPLVEVQRPVAERNKIPYVGQYNIQSWFEGGQVWRYAFSAWPYNSEIGSRIWDWWDSLPVDARPMRVAAITPNLGVSEEQVDAFVQGAKKRGVDVVAQETYDLQAQDLSGLVLKIKSAKPDVIFDSGFIEDGILFCRQSIDLGLNAKLFVMPIVAEYNQLANVLGTKVNFLVTSTFWNNKMTTPESQELAEFFQNQRGVPATAISGSYLTSMQVLFDAIGRASSLDSDAIREAIASTDLMTAMGRVRFDTNQVASTLHVILVQWQNGVQQIVWPNESSTAQLLYPMPYWST
jgi:branched-chain amino acid transport system substrate-binding protein